MTTDPTPHTERAAAAAAELARNGYLPTQTAPMIDAVARRIAKHFNDDAAKDAYHYRYALILAGCPEDDVDNPPDLINWARRNNQQHDALRLAAGRALELLREAPYYDKPRDPIAEAITALSAALAGDNGKET